MMKKILSFFAMLALILSGQCGFAEELLPGDFSALDPESCIPDQWVIHGNKAMATVTPCDDGKSAITLRNNGNVPDWLQIKYSLPLKSTWRKLVLRGTLRISGLVVGNQKWKTASIMPRFLDADKKFITNYQGVEWRKDGYYRNFSRTITIPREARSLTIDAGFMGCNGIMELSKLSLTVADQVKAYSPESRIPALT
jgi:hypothetical protein